MTVFNSKRSLDFKVHELLFLLYVSFIGKGSLFSKLTKSTATHEISRRSGIFNVKSDWKNWCHILISTRGGKNSSPRDIFALYKIAHKIKPGWKLVAITL